MQIPNELRNALNKVVEKSSDLGDGYFITDERAFRRLRDVWLQVKSGQDVAPEERPAELETPW